MMKRAALNQLIYSWHRVSVKLGNLIQFSVVIAESGTRMIGHALWDSFITPKSSIFSYLLPYDLSLSFWNPVRSKSDNLPGFCYYIIGYK